MAQSGDTITYTFSDGTSVAEDVSNVDKAAVEYCNGAGGEAGGASAAGSGGRVETATINTSSISTLYIWVGGSIQSGRYDGGDGIGGFFRAGDGGGSTEIATVDTTSSNSSDEPFLIGAGGGAGGASNYPDEGGGGARGGGNGAGGNGPPLGGDSNDFKSQPGGDGEGAIDDKNRGLVSGGTTIKGGGSSADTNGEVQITYRSLPDAPSNLSQVKL